MANRLRCRAVFDGCYCEATGESEAEAEVMQTAAHAVAAQGVGQITVELTRMIRAA